ncbi:hypothetical protein EHQ58_12210 [Leptospira ognonensis]|uniref:Uncharacterized protein n=1 Tax=Leptospira ognonensis TaxID=2484945 RepID=A0A4R9JZL2_9LEPT|nr:hypothetical protein [Leptospira ognonensis]TGL58139.1 hypothetical protein EHQ58_12210 [Leptospira ognonensis]
MTSFSEIDFYLDRLYPNRLSLNPEKNVTNSFLQIESFLKPFGLTDEHLKLVAENTLLIVESAVFHFPENIFWDFDFLIFRLTENSLFSSDFKETFLTLSNQILKIFALFGAHSSIQFRYIHDLIYGYDWLKWMLEKRLLDENADPFGMPFLNYIHARGEELVCLIQKNDKDYPQIKGVYRNPFLFSRTSEEEIKLHKDLSSSGNIPIEAWSIIATPRSDKNYSMIRLERSKELGIGKNFLPGSHKI